MNIPENPAGYWLSEKFDGVRNFITDGGTMLSRSGHRFNPPQWFMDGLPRGVRLDCELYAGRGGFDHLVSEIQRKKSDWQGITLIVLDIAILHVPIESRIAMLGRLKLPSWVKVANHRLCAGNDDLDATEHDIVSGGGEGCVLRSPASFYRPHGFIKVKRLFPDLNRSVLD